MSFSSTTSAKSRPASLPAARTDRDRLDQALVERGLCDSRERAKRLILAGQVASTVTRRAKPSDNIKPADELALDAVDKFVSRGGHKLEHALEHFHIDVTGLVAMDLGHPPAVLPIVCCSGAPARFLPWMSARAAGLEIAADPRVVVMEKTNARYLKPENFPAPPTWPWWTVPSSP